MKGVLFNNLMVELDPRTAELGGSFEGTVAYAPEPLMWAYQYLSPRIHPLLIDVGASTGSYTLLAALLASLEVIAFEPALLTFEVLKRNIQLNLLSDRVTAVQAAVADYDGEGVLHVIDPPSQIALSQLGGVPHHTKHGHGETVPVVTLDIYLKTDPPHIDLIKIDTEGSELLVLRGAEQTIHRYHPALLIEVNPQNTAGYGYAPQAITDLLAAWGYAIQKVGGVDIAAVYP